VSHGSILEAAPNKTNSLKNSPAAARPVVRCQT
jgi:hypothetical protein